MPSDQIPAPPAARRLSCSPVKAKLNSEEKAVEENDFFYKDGKAVVPNTEPCELHRKQESKTRRDRLSVERLPLQGEDVSLSHRNLGPEYTPAIISFINEGQVKKLQLSGIEFGDESSKELAGCLASNDTLTSLSLHGCAIGDEGGRALAEAITQNTSLRSLFLTGNPMSCEVLDELRAANESRPVPMSGLCGLVL